MTVLNYSNVLETIIAVSRVKQLGFGVTAVPSRSGWIVTVDTSPDRLAEELFVFSI